MPVQLVRVGVTDSEGRKSHERRKLLHDLIRLLVHGLSLKVAMRNRVGIHDGNDCSIADTNEVAHSYALDASDHHRHSTKYHSSRQYQQPCSQPATRGTGRDRCWFRTNGASSGDRNPTSANSFSEQCRNMSGTRMRMLASWRYRARVSARRRLFVILTDITVGLLVCLHLCLHIIMRNSNSDSRRCTHLHVAVVVRFMQ